MSKTVFAAVSAAISICTLGCLLAMPAAAQTGEPSHTKDPLSAFVQGSWKTSRANLTNSAEKMPEEFYGLRPGAQKEVRTFGQLIGHLANFNYLWCAEAKGEKNPDAGTDFEKLTAKADLVKALDGALTYCDGVYSGLTDANGMEMVEMTGMGGRKSQTPRMTRLIMNVIHNNEHYGNIVTYMRIKSIVPPSSEQR